MYLSLTYSTLSPLASPLFHLDPSLRLSPPPLSLFLSLPPSLTLLLAHSLGVAARALALACLSSRRRDSSNLPVQPRVLVLIIRLTKPKRRSPHLPLFLCLSPSFHTVSPHLSLLSSGWRGAWRRLRQLGESSGVLVSSPVLPGSSIPPPPLPPLPHLPPPLTLADRLSLCSPDHYASPVGGK